MQLAFRLRFIRDADQLGNSLRNAGAPRSPDLRERFVLEDRPGRRYQRWQRRVVGGQPCVGIDNAAMAAVADKGR